MTIQINEKTYTYCEYKYLADLSYNDGFGTVEHLEEVVEAGWEDEEGRAADALTMRQINAAIQSQIQQDSTELTQIFEDIF